MGQPMIFDSSQFNAQLIMGVTGSSASSSVASTSSALPVRPTLAMPPTTAAPQQQLSRAEIDDPNYTHPRACHKRQQPDGSTELTESDDDDGVDTTTVRRGRGRPVGRRNSPTTVDDKVK